MIPFSFFLLLKSNMNEYINTKIAVKNNKKIGILFS